MFYKLKISKFFTYLSSLVPVVVTILNSHRNHAKFHEGTQNVISSLVTIFKVIVNVTRADEMPKQPHFFRPDATVATDIHGGNALGE